MSTTSLFSPTRLLRGLACAFYGIGLAFCAPLAMLLLVVAETWTGRVFALTTLAALAVPASFLFLRLARKHWRREGRRYALPLQLSAATALVLVPVLLWLAPAGTSVAGAAVQSVHLDGSSYPRWSPWNLLPEIDHVKLGTVIVPAVDPYIDGARALRLRELILPYYREMRRQPAYRDLGSCMPDTYRSFAGWPRPDGHCYLLLPEAAAGEKLPLLLFLHGSWGNFRFYPAAFERFAQEHRVVVAFPTQGFGTWPDEETVPLLTRVLDHCLASYPVDGERVYLAGISNGGIGLASAAVPLADRLAGLIFVSAILRPRSTENPAFAEALAGRPVLMLHGEADRRIPVAGISESARFLQERGIDVTLRTYPHEDHFLLVSQIEEVQARMAELIDP